LPPDLVYTPIDGTSQGADATASLHNAHAYPNPAVNADPTIRVMMGIVNSVEITIFDVSGHVVNSATLSSARDRQRPVLLRLHLDGP
jgi:hypothetical protein